MDDLALQQGQREALDWARAAQAAGWLSEHDLKSFATLELRGPEILFSGDGRRPLVVALFGGTGVGKSTLLNRLAGQDIAQTGVVRPTSREISVYTHEAVEFGSSAADLPLESIRVARHANELFRHVFWVDMPDFDSTDCGNRDLVLRWLPHIDVVIYVVNPERYRDDRGWRLLLDHEREHAWLFVFNQWDRAHPAQLEDFGRLLREGGFANPVLLRTDCRPDPVNGAADDFHQLVVFVQQLATEKSTTQLVTHNRAARIQILGETLRVLLERLGSDATYERLTRSWDSAWKTTEAKLVRGLQWAVQELAWRFVRRDGSLLQRRLDMNSRREIDPDASSSANLLWDEWAQLCFDDALDALVVECCSAGLPTLPLREALVAERQLASRRVLDSCQLMLRDALSNPGSRAQRIWLKVFGALAVVAPLVAIAWVSYEVVIEYYESIRDGVPFLGSNFAIHSGLLIAVAWLLPYFVHRKLQPSTERAARRGLQAGLRHGLEELSRSVIQALGDYRQAAATQRDHGARILTELGGQPGEERDDALRRLLASATEGR